MATIITKHEDGDATDLPTVLAHGELAVNSQSKKLWVGDATTAPILLSNSGGATLAEITQVAHGFVLGDAIRWDEGTTAWVKAQANAADTLALGVVVTVRDTNTFEYATSGRFERTAHGLTVDQWLYLSDVTPGLLQTTEPLIYSQPLVYVDSANNFTVYPYRPAEINSDQKIPDGTVDGQTLRWEADTSTWDASSALIVDDTGNVGIGTTTPEVVADQTTLTINGTNASRLSLYSGGAKRAELTSSFLGTTLSAEGNTPITFAAAGTDHMRILSDGNVGIGVIAPEHLLEVSSSDIASLSTGTIKTLTSASGTTGNIGIEIQSQAESTTARTYLSCNTLSEHMGALFSTADGNWGLRSSNLPNNMVFITGTGGGTERMRIDSGGNLLVGTTTITPVLAPPDVEFGASVFEGHLSIGNNLTMRRGGAGANYITVGNNTDGDGALLVRGNTNVTWATVSDANGWQIGSDERLKDNIADIDYGLDTVLALRPVSFTWKDGVSGDSIGFIAQEVLPLIPEVIGEMGEEGEERYTMAKDQLTAVLVKAIQEQQAQIDELRAQIGASS